jgi:hypothetical protein
LRVYTGDLDDEIASLVRAARDYCERYTQRTLRKTVTRTLTLRYWWSQRDYDNCTFPPSTAYYSSTYQKLPWPPLITVSGITYFDTDNASQTLGTSNYTVETGADGAARIIWTSTATIPAVYDRPDAITITFTTGYSTIEPTSANPLPPVALQAMKTKLTELWGAGTENEVKAAKEATDRLLGMVDWTGYA